MSQLSEYNHSTDSEKKKEDWMNAKWRPMMGWMYMGVCVFDFVIDPILWTAIQALYHGGINTQWQPLTLQGGGLFHVAMGAVIGISAYGRTKEKLSGAENGGIVPAGQPMGTQYVPPGGMPGGMGMNNGMGGGFGGQQGGMGGGFGGQQGGMGGGQQSGGFGSPAPAFGSTPAPAFGSTPAPAFGSAPTTGGFSSGFSGTTPAPAVTPTTNASGQKVVPQATQPML